MDFVSRDEAANLLGVSKRTLERWATKKKGPTYYRRGRRATYMRADLLNWIMCEQRMPCGATP